VRLRGVGLDVALAEAPGAAALDGRDRAFARLLVATYFRRFAAIEAVIDALVERRRGIAPETLAALRLGIAQIRYIGTPAHAAVDASVDLVPPHLGRGQRALVNAVLRRVVDHDPAADPPPERASLAPWLADTLTAAWGPARARAIAAAGQANDPPLDLSVAADADGWAARLGATLLPTGCLRLTDAGAVDALPGFAEGGWWVQDAAAALPARLLGAGPGMIIADLCAAPGGKTAQLAASGARVLAIDRSAPRMARVAANLARLGLDAERIVADAASWTPPTPLDAVLVDAPCTASGTWRRHPDAAWSKSPDDLARLVALQDRLIDAAWRMLRPGGRLVYCTCSLLPAEGEEVVGRLLASGAPVARLPVTEIEVGDPAFVTTVGDLRSFPDQWPMVGGIDGFYAARLIRTH
jgi:16S rRNA (cytosine967-C5)-methyltransferase